MAAGLFYQEGYFHQMLDAGGWQFEIYPPHVPLSLPPGGAPTDRIRADIVATVDPMNPAQR